MNNSRKLLQVKLIPKTAWFVNLRSELTKDEWDSVRKKTYKLYNYKCAICSGKGNKHPVECHEIWQYDSQKRIQKLKKTIALCPLCHKTIHFGLSSIRGEDEVCIRHLMKINNWTKTQSVNHIKNQFLIWNERSKIKWKLDATWLLKFVKVSDETKQKILNHANDIT